VFLTSARGRRKAAHAAAENSAEKSRKCGTPFDGGCGTVYVFVTSGSADACGKRNRVTAAETSPPAPLHPRQRQTTREGGTQSHGPPAGRQATEGMRGSYRSAALAGTPGPRPGARTSFPSAE